MSDVPKTCPYCGRPFAGEGVRGFCPSCLGKLAFAVDNGPARESGDPGPHSPEAEEQRRLMPAAATPGPGRDAPPAASLRCFGDYELIQEIARGGMGVVFKARQRNLDRVVALKLLLSGQFASREAIERFRAEALTAAKLQHANIVPVYDVGEANGQPFIAMELVAGQSLAEAVRDRPLPARRAAELLRTIAEAVQYAHTQGVLHRDLKPSNVLLDESGQPRVTDFGLAKRLPLESATRNPESALDLTHTGEILGSPSFIAPEQAAGKRGDLGPTVDTYSLGAILFHLLTGRPPFQSATIEETLQAVLQREPVPPRLLNPGVPRDLETVCLKCLEKEPGRRYATVRELADELARFLRDEPVRACPISAPEKWWRWCRRRPLVAGLALALSLVGAAGLAGILWQWGRANQHATRESAQRQRAEQAVTLLELQRIEDLLEKDEIVTGVAYLARMVRQQPANQLAARRLLSALIQREFALPTASPLGHGSRVWYAEFSPDGRRVATASLDLTAQVWDARTGRPLLGPMVHPNAVRFAHFSPDGGRLLTFADDACAYLWEVATGQRLGAAMAHGKKIRTAQFSPDGNLVLTASNDGTARLWDARTGEPVWAPLRHQGPVLSARFSPDGTRILTASDDRTARVWDTGTGELRGQPLLHSNSVSGAEFSPDGKRVVTIETEGHSSLTCVWNISSGKKLTNPLRHPNEFIKIATFSPDGQRILTASAEGTARIWNASDWAPLGRPALHRGGISTAEFSQDGQRVLTASADNLARVWDLESGEPPTAPLQHDDLVISARFSPDGLFAVTASADQTARIWDVRAGMARHQRLPAPARWPGASFSPDGESIASTGESGSARLWNAWTAQPGPLLTGVRGVIHLRWSPDGRRLAACGDDRTTRIWDTRTGTPVIEPIRHSQPMTDLKFSPDGQWLATAAWDGQLHQWSVATGETRGEPIANRDKIEFFAYSPNGQRLLCCDFKDDQARLHDAATGRLLGQTPSRPGRILHGDFSQDGQRLVTASEDGIARIWRSDTLQSLSEPLRHKGPVLWAKFSLDGQRVVTGSEDGTARVWDASTGQPVGEPLAHRAGVSSVDFSPDALLVATASRDGTARLWDAATGRPASEPFGHSGPVLSVRFNPNGRRLLTVSGLDGARAWDVPPAAGNVESASAVSLTGSRQVVQSSDPPAGSKPAIEATLLLAKLAEAIIGKRVNAQGALENCSSGHQSVPFPLKDDHSRSTVPPTNGFASDLAEVRQGVAGLRRDADFTRWLEWFLADRSARAISPYSPVTVPRYTEALLEEENVAAWHEALLLCPTNATAFARLAEYHLRQARASSSTNTAEADWGSRQAVKLGPARFESWTRRVEIVEYTGAWTQLLAEAEQVIQVQTNNAYAWHSKACAHEALSQFHAVVPACDRALEICRQDPFFQSDTNLARHLRLKRGTALRHLGRLSEAGADIAVALGLAPRDPGAGTNLVDLGAFYNGAGDGQTFSNGIQRLAGVDFDARGWVQLDLRLVWAWQTDLPDRVDGIAIEKTCQRLHFLHTATLASHLAPGRSGAPEEVFDSPLGGALGRYVVHYADGQQAEVPIIHGRDVRDYWHFQASTPDDPALVVAWAGSTAASREHGATVRFYKQAWENPRPAVLIKSLDFVHAKTHAVPILVAITVE